MYKMASTAAIGGHVVFVFLCLFLFLSAQELPAYQATKPLGATKIQDAQNDSIASIKALRRDLDAFREKIRSADIRMLQQAATFDLICLYYRILQHDDYAGNQRLQGLRAQTVSVLKDTLQQFKRYTQKEARSATFSRSENSEWSQSEMQAEETLALQCHEWHSRYSRRLMLGPLTSIGAIPANFGPTFDYQSLVALIEATVQPNIWRTAGGEATIGVHDPAIALVIFAPWSVHDELEDLLLQLR